MREMEQILVCKKSRNAQVTANCETRAWLVGWARFNDPLGTV